MTAGSILAPQVIPLRASIPGKAKHEIDTNTLVAIKSDSSAVTIYYTLDGSKPQLFRKFGSRDHTTFKYQEPITLPDGKITIKALAVTKDGRESAIVTRVFVVEYVTPNTDGSHEDNAEESLNVLCRQEMGNELSDLRLGEKEVNVESNFSCSGVVREFQGLSQGKSYLCSLLSGPRLLNASDVKEESNAATLPQLQAWEQADVSLPTPTPNLAEKKQQGTQTIGLFYPSSKLLEQQSHRLASQKKQQNKISHPKVTAISPGQGYWRQQLAHICAHLRSYAQNNLEFRSVVGEPQLGRLISATVHKDSNQVSLHINYALAESKESKPVAFCCPERSPSGEVGAGLYDSQSAGDETSPSEKARRRMSTWKCLGEEDKLTAESRQLLREVGPEGQGQPFLVEQLIDEGADPNCTDGAGPPALTLAVLNKHPQVIPVLVQKGADIDRQSGRLKNTALHEALSLGLGGLGCIEALLRCNASIKKENAHGLTACDMALKSGNDQIMSLFAGKLG
ncbi:double zinc ribbon and ankyrin repeat-containing protein 1 [Varanus komodoensis]|uniref:double zinc ribbon and ankyrin repeat-containing protein 1 n=1 Tax=Varanus komodoensis TaxID=61221 RepID=UPI001CF7A592|nr:double zinc ribbon and ankyrin repeat-containing protein 1 [Varanus komodoensis]